MAEAGFTLVTAVPGATLGVIGAIVPTAGAGVAADEAGAVEDFSAASLNGDKATINRIKEKKTFKKAGLEGEKRFMRALISDQYSYYTAQGFFICVGELG